MVDKLIATEPALARPPAAFGTTADAAALLRCSQGHIRRLVGQKRLPVLKPFGATGASRFDMAELEAFVLASRVEPRAR